MEVPTIIKQTKEYMLIKVPLPQQGIMVASKPIRRDKKLAMSAEEKRLTGALQESERDVRIGRVITAPNITEALRRYEKRQWD